MQCRDRDIPSKHKSFIKSLSKSITVSLSKIAKDGLFIETLEEVVDALSGDCSGGSPQIGIHLRRKPRSVLHWLQRLQGRGELRSGRLWLMIRFNNIQLFATLCLQTSLAMANFLLAKMHLRCKTLRTFFREIIEPVSLHRSRKGGDIEGELPPRRPRA